MNRLRKKSGFEGKDRKSVPPRLKPSNSRGIYGTAEAVPLQWLKNVYQNSVPKGRLNLAQDASPVFGFPFFSRLV
jgi:hypothetical protein